MIVHFYLEHIEDHIFTVETDDVAGFLAAVQGDHIIYIQDAYRYSSHILSFRLENATLIQELNIHVVPYVPEP